MTEPTIEISSNGRGLATALIRGSNGKIYSRSWIAFATTDISKQKLAQEAEAAAKEAVLRDWRASEGVDADPGV